MFTNTDEVMILAKKNSKEKVYKLKLDRRAKEEYVRKVNQYVNEFLYDAEDNLKTFNAFENNYYNADDENFKINDFELSEEIRNAIDFSDSLEAFVVRQHDIINDEGYQIKAILIGGKSTDCQYYVAGQRFTNKQILFRKGFSLILSNDTFTKEECRFTIAIPEKIDCLLRGNELVFQKYSSANGVFDLSEYYREASNEEINTLKTNEAILIENTAMFDKMVNGMFVRKKIAKILDIHALDDIDRIKNAAQALNFAIPLTADAQKIVWPTNTNEQKNLLKFLAEELYSGSITSQKYVSNSTKKV